VKDRQKEAEPASVTVSKQAGDTQRAEKWGWVEPSVWTDRMLAALEDGVKGGKWYSLMDKVYTRSNFESAWQKVKSNRGAAGVDGQSILKFEKKLLQNIEYTREELRTDRYEPKPVKRKWIPKPGSTKQRPLGIPTVKDRVVQTALRNVIEPIFEAKFSENSFGFRPGRGCKGALREVDRLLKTGYAWVVDADLKNYFDSIDHERLMDEVKKEISDGRILGLVEGYLKQHVLDGLKEWEPEKGTPQGAVISPLLANIFLHPVDVAMAEAGYRMIRYADDLVVLCLSLEEAEAALSMVRALAEGRGLALHSEKTRIIDATKKGGFEFLGYHFERGKRWPRQKSILKFRDSVRKKTPRTSGKSLAVIVGETNKTLRGWFEYFKHSCKATFRPLDGWVRMRLRSILRKRSGRRGRGRGADNQRWPNAFFEEMGLFTLVTAHRNLCRSQ